MSIGLERTSTKTLVRDENNIPVDWSDNKEVERCNRYEHCTTTKDGICVNSKGFFHVTDLRPYCYKSKKP